MLLLPDGSLPYVLKIIVDILFYRVTNYHNPLLENQIFIPLPSKKIPKLIIRIKNCRRTFHHQT